MRRLPYADTAHQSLVIQSYRRNTDVPGEPSMQVLRIDPQYASTYYGVHTMISFCSCILRLQFALVQYPLSMDLITERQYFDSNPQNLRIRTAGVEKSIHSA